MSVVRVVFVARCACAMLLASGAGYASDYLRALFACLCSGHCLLTAVVRRTVTVPTAHAVLPAGCVVVGRQQEPFAGACGALRGAVCTVLVV